MERRIWYRNERKNIHRRNRMKEKEVKKKIYMKRQVIQMSLSGALPFTIPPSPPQKLELSRKRKKKSMHHDMKYQSQNEYIA